jgi:hypothetical protein
VALVRTDVSEELSTSFIRVTRIGELGTTLAVTSSPILVTLMGEELSSSETSVLTRATWRNIPEDTIFYSHRRENLKYCLSWFNENELILNIRKPCALSFHPRQRKRVCKPSIVYNEVNIPYKSDVKFLGIQVTENLRWIIHIKSICSYLNKAYFIIKT